MDTGNFIEYYKKSSFVRFIENVDFLKCLIETLNSCS